MTTRSVWLASGVGLLAAACGGDHSLDDSFGPGAQTPTSGLTDPSTSSDGTTGAADSSTSASSSGDGIDGDSTSHDPSDADTTAGETSDSGGAEGCLEDAECPLGTLCHAGTCEPGCNRDHGCEIGLACCGDECVDVLTDLAHCGGCDMPCAPADANGECVGGQCSIGACNAGHEDCNGATNDGCEVAGACTCAPNQPYDCYSGPAGTEDVGICVGGTQTCNAQGTALGPCTGQTLPGAEVCNNGADDDCDDVTDEDPDLDGDGWTQCGGDCCDEIGVGCFDPELVNPGAFEFDGNLVDDDCDGNVDNVLPPCDAGLMSNSNNSDNYARAIDLCQFTTANPADPADRIWGVISTGLHLADGAGAPAADSRALRPGFGTAIVPQSGNRLAVLSTGHAADSNDVNPGFAAFEGGEAMGTSSGFPADWFAANGNVLPNAPFCPASFGATAFNPVMFTADVRVPTNAQSFSVRMYFFSAEYPEWVCTEFNDLFVTLVTSSADNPADGNIAIYDDGVNQWPVGVNILAAADGLFTQCANAADLACGFGVNYNGCTGTNELTGTGFDLGAPGCLAGGGTGWLSMTGNVTPGEVMTIRFVIWDTSDEVYDSLVLLDDFQWSVDASEPGVQPG